MADMHDLTLIHTDLKPENILLVSSEYTKVPDYKVWDSAIGPWCCCQNVGFESAGVHKNSLNDYILFLVLSRPTLHTYILLEGLW